MSRDSTANTLKVAILLCVVCSLTVSVAAVGLRARQNANKELFRKQNVLQAAGLVGEDEEVSRDEIEKRYQRIQPRIVYLKEGVFAGTDRVGVDEVSDYDQLKASRDNKLSRELTTEEDIASIKRLEKYAFVYLLMDEAGENIEQYIIPIRGYGLWSTMHGFLALDKDTTTIRGITFYEHGETPGLGGEIENPQWKSQWQEKEAYNEKWEPTITVIKGSVDSDDPQKQHKVDGLSGATITSNGVSNMMTFWLGDLGYGKFLENQRNKQ